MLKEFFGEFVEGIDTPVLSGTTKAETFAARDRNADVVLSAEGSYPARTIAVDKDGIVDWGTDAGDVLKSVYANLDDPSVSLGKSRVLLTPGQYEFGSTPEVTRQGVEHVGVGRNSVTLRADSALTSLFDVASSRTSRLVNGPTWRNLTFQGAGGNAQHAVTIDSSRDGAVQNVETDSFAGHAFRAESTVDENIDGWEFANIRDTESAGVFQSVDGSAGQFADSVLRQCRTNGLSGWGVDLQDTERVTVRGIEAGNNSAGFNGAVRVLADAHGAKNNRLVNVYAENNIATPTAESVRVDAATGAADFAESTEVVRPASNPAGNVPHAVVTSADAGDTRDTRVHDPQQLALSTLIDVQSGAVETDVRVNFEGDAYALVSDSGTRTTVNGLGRNAGDPAAGGQWNTKGYEGVMVRDTTNANTYVYNAGTWSQIASA